jgi:hypothetical protein
MESPKKNELEMSSWTSLDMDGAYESPLKWVATGNRDNHGTLRYSAYWGFYWSSTIINNSLVKSLAIIDTDTAEIIDSGKIFGHAIRCIRDY